MLIINTNNTFTKPIRERCCGQLHPQSLIVAVNDGSSVTKITKMLLPQVDNTNNLSEEQNEEYDEDEEDDEEVEETKRTLTIVENKKSKKTVATPKKSLSKEQNKKAKVEVDKTKNDLLKEQNEKTKKAVGKTKKSGGNDEPLSDDAAVATTKKESKDQEAAAKKVLDFFETNKTEMVNGKKKTAEQLAADEQKKREKRTAWMREYRAKKNPTPKIVKQLTEKELKKKEQNAARHKRWREKKKLGGAPIVDYSNRKNISDLDPSNLATCGFILQTRNSNGELLQEIEQEEVSRTIGIRSSYYAEMASLHLLLERLIAKAKSSSSPLSSSAAASASSSPLPGTKQKVIIAWDCLSCIQKLRTGATVLLSHFDRCDFEMWKLIHEASQFYELHFVHVYSHLKLPKKPSTSTDEDSSNNSSNNNNNIALDILELHEKLDENINKYRTPSAKVFNFPLRRKEIKKKTMKAAEEDRKERVNNRASYWTPVEAAGIKKFIGVHVDPDGKEPVFVQKLQRARDFAMNKIIEQGKDVDDDDEIEETATKKTKKQKNTPATAKTTAPATARAAAATKTTAKKKTTTGGKPAKTTTNNKDTPPITPEQALKIINKLPQRLRTTDCEAYVINTSMTFNSRNQIRLLQARIGKLWIHSGLLHNKTTPCRFCEEDLCMKRGEPPIRHFLCCKKLQATREEAFKDIAIFKKSNELDQSEDYWKYHCMEIVFSKENEKFFFDYYKLAVVLFYENKKAKKNENQQDSATTIAAAANDSGDVEHPMDEEDDIVAELQQQ